MFSFGSQLLQLRRKLLRLLGLFGFRSNLLLLPGGAELIQCLLLGSQCRGPFVKRLFELIGGDRLGPGLARLVFILHFFLSSLGAADQANGSYFQGNFGFNQPKGAGSWNFANGNTVEGIYTQTKRADVEGNEIKLSWRTTSDITC